MNYFIMRREHVSYRLIGECRQDSHATARHNHKKTKVILSYDQKKPIALIEHEANFGRIKIYSEEEIRKIILKREWAIISRDPLDRKLVTWKTITATAVATVTGALAAAHFLFHLL